MSQNHHKNQGVPYGPAVSSTTFGNACGIIPYNMTNDYMFRAVLQSNNKVLRGLICSMLHLTEQQITSVRITNPIVLGEAIENKEIRLDINIILNDSTLINLEMQVANKLNWKNRSVTYLCRSFDSLSHGQDYIEAKTAIHIGFLDYTLFDDCPEFYASYKLINVKNHQIYSDSLTLNVVDLSRIDLATEEDRQYNVHYWASLFKAATWEDIRMIASKNEYLNEAAKTVFQMSVDEKIRKQCRDREEYYQDMKNYERALSDRDLTISSYKKAIAEKDDIIVKHKRHLADCESVIAESENRLANCESVIAEKEAEIQRLLAENEKLRVQK